MSVVDLEVYTGDPLSWGEERRIPAGVGGAVLLLAAAVEGLEYPGRPRLLREGADIDVPGGVEDISLPTDVASRFYDVLGRFMDRGSELSKAEALQGFGQIAGVDLKEPIGLISGEHRQRPARFASNTGYVAVNADTREAWPFWTYQYEYNHRALAYLPGGLVTVRAADIARVGDYIFPLVEGR